MKINILKNNNINKSPSRTKPAPNLNRYKNRLRINLKHFLYCLPGIFVFFQFNNKLVSAFTDEKLTNYDNFQYKIEKDKKGISQIKIIQNEKTLSITDTNYNHAKPDISGENIVWMSQIDSTWQIFKKHIPTNKTLQLTYDGNNVNPLISRDNIAWEKQIDGIWQIILFTKAQKFQITDNPRTKQLIAVTDDYVVYHQKSSDEIGWELYLYDIASKTNKNISQGDYSNIGEINEKSVKWTSLDKNGKKYKNTHNLLSGETTSIEFTNLIQNEQNDENDSALVNKPKFIRNKKVDEINIEDLKEEYDEEHSINPPEQSEQDSDNQSNGNENVETEDNSEQNSDGIVDGSGDTLINENIPNAILNSGSDSEKDSGRQNTDSPTQIDTKESTQSEN